MCLFLVPEPVRNRFSYFFLIFPLKFVIPIGFLVNPVVWARNLGQYSPLLSESQKKLGFALDKLKILWYNTDEGNRRGVFKTSLKEEEDNTLSRRSVEGKKTQL